MYQNVHWTYTLYIIYIYTYTYICIQSTYQWVRFNDIYIYIACLHPSQHDTSNADHSSRDVTGSEPSYPPDMAATTREGKTTGEMFPKIVGFPPKSPILIGFSIIFTIHFGGNTTIFGNTQVNKHGVGLAALRFVVSGSFLVESLVDVLSVSPVISKRNTAIWRAVKAAEAENNKQFVDLKKWHLLTATPSDDFFADLTLRSVYLSGYFWQKKLDEKCWSLCFQQKEILPKFQG